MPPRRAAAVAAAAAPKRAARPSRRATTPPSDEQGDESQDMATPQPASRSRPSRATAGRGMRVVDSDDEEQEQEQQDDDDDDFDDSPVAKKAARAAVAPKSRAAPAKAPQPKKSSPAHDQDEDDDDDDDEGDATIMEASRVASSEATESSEEGEEDEDERVMLKRGPAPVAASRKSKSPEPDAFQPRSSLSTGAPASATVPAPPSVASSQQSSQGVPPTPRTQMRGASVAATPRGSYTQRTPGSARFSSVAGTPSSQMGATPSSSAPPKTRLVIHKMVLKDFKSYAGVQDIGPFHKSFSAVVGPNGSGKSNVIDALLFVFGWRANKMRQGKLSELIHNSAGKENLPQCSVEVWFREIVDLPGPDAFSVVPGSKLVVARTAFRNNSSQYTINSRKSTFTEVTTMLKGRGIDLDHKRFLILQGEVESIAQMPPKAKNEHEEGLLEYLEDIIGTSEYKAPIEEAAKMVDEANEQRSERLSRLKIVQREKDNLESKKREAEEHLRDQNELAQRQSALWQVYMLECKDQMKVAQNAIEGLQKRREEETAKHAGSKAEIEELQAEYDALAAEFDKISKETDKVVKELAKYEKEDVQMQEKKKHLETKRKKLAKSLNDDKHAASEAKATFSSASDEATKYSAELAKLEAELEKEEAELEKVRDSLKGKTEAFSAAIEKKQRELQPWVAKISERKNARDIAAEERSLLEEKAGHAEDEVVKAREALEELEATHGAKREELVSLEQEKAEALKKAAAAEAQVGSMGQQETELRSRAVAARAKAEEAKASATANTSRGAVLSSLSRQAEMGIIKGFHGRLGSLGVIDDRYDVAISTACPGLDNIVVDEVPAAQACIEYLRRHNLGRANFIVLQKLPKMNLEAIETPEGVPRLFDLVKPKDARFAPAFYHLLRDTLVAKDLPSANRIAYGAQRWRVVTLDGQLIDKSGTMSGGGARVARGGMSSTFAADEVSPAQLAKLEKERQVAEASLMDVVNSRKALAEMLEKHKARVPQIEMAMEKINMDLTIGKKRIVEAKSRLDELESGLQPDAGDAERIAELDAELASLDEEIEKLSEKTSAIQSDIDGLQEKILEVGGVRLRSQKSTVDGIRNMIELNGERVTKAEVTRAKAEKDMAKLAKSTETNGATLASLEEELEELAKVMRSKATAVDAVREKVDKAQAVLDEKQESRDEIKAQLDAHSDVINAFRALEMEIKQKLEDNERSLADNQKRHAHWEEKHSHLRLHRLSEDEEEEEDEEGQGEVSGEAAAETSAEGAEDEEGEVSKESAPAARRRVKKEPRDEDEDDDDDDDEYLQLQEYPTDELRAIDKESIKAEIVVFEEKVAKGSGNLSVLEEYRKREQEWLSRARDLEETTKQRDSAKQRYDDLRKQRLESFMAGFNIISSKLKEMYATITLGGMAELELVDSLDPFSEGILFSVMPPKKSWKNISNLSGGEKTLSSLALVFALHVFKPTPLYVMDEIDAALDFRNVSIVANLIKERTKNAQFVIISLRNNMFELASRLVGIYKTNGQTKSLAVHNKDLHAPPPAPPSSASSMTAPSPRPSHSGLPSSQSYGGGFGSVAPTPSSRHIVPATPSRLTFRAPLGSAAPGSAIPSSAASRKTIDALHRRTSGATLVPPTPLALRNRQQ